ncbi:MAG: class I SAM-dependent methyltransferase [Desulfobacteraceae bacterium]|nr:class I SAM-dependent methyltransferase [Desulfobacteraceae bacterium]
MNDDNWKDYQRFKISNQDVNAYYDLVRTAFIKGVEKVSPPSKFSNAIDLGCGSGELTQELLKYADLITGVDSSPKLIQLAQQTSDPMKSNFVLSDVLDQGFFSLLNEERFDLVTAAWLHNHLLHETEQHQLLKRILDLLNPEGAFVFLIPSSAFASPRTQSFIAKLGWKQAWLEESYHCSKGVYSFSDSDWVEMNVWQPMWLADLYMKDFSVNFLDVKAISLSHRGMGDSLIEPPFDVMFGHRKESINKV